MGDEVEVREPQLCAPPPILHHQEAHCPLHAHSATHLGSSSASIDVNPLDVAVGRPTADATALVRRRRSCAAAAERLTPLKALLLQLQIPLDDSNLRAAMAAPRP